MPKIFINPGHAPNGQPDPGAVNSVTGLRECDIALNVAVPAGKYLTAVGYEVRILQSDSLEEIVATANEWPADIFISIHCNAAMPAAAGTETWHWYNSVKSNKLAGCIQNQIVSSLPVVDRGLKEAVPGRSLYVLKCTDMPACLAELAFISNEGDEKLLASRQDDFARAVARGITDYFA